MEDPLRATSRRSLLRFLTCGSVDDGKSTLIGRLLYDTKALFDDQVAALEGDSRRFGTTGAGNLDLALLVDGLASEREQGITIDVAWRYFSTPKRAFIVADTPGHDQYTRNMVTGASSCEAAVVLVDARCGLTTQTRRHMTLVSLMGIRDLVLAVNKMDLTDWNQDVFEALASDARAFAATLGLPAPVSIPLSAKDGDNVTRPARPAAASWYTGPPLLDWLETVDARMDQVSAPFRFPVQMVIRPNGDFRGFAGLVSSGMIRPGDEVRVLPLGRETTIDRIVTFDGDLDRAVAGQSVVLTLTDPVDVARGDVIAFAPEAPAVSDQFSARLVWLGEAPLLPQRRYLLRLGPATVGVQISDLKSRLDIDSLTERPASTLDLNDIGQVTLALDRPVAFDPYQANRDMGGFILIDRLTNATVGCGMIDFALRRADNIHWQALKVDAQARETLMGHRAGVLWFTGLSGAGKSTIADRVEQMLLVRGVHTMVLDGDNVRHGLNRDLGFTDADRVENIRRFAEVAKLMTDAGLIVLVSVISPFTAERRMARTLFPKDAFIEIFVDAPLSVCEARDPKGLYKKARAGLIPNFTGLGSPYEPPEHPEIHLHTDREDPNHMAERIMEDLRRRKFI